jgi:hypothetical protein
MTPLSASSAILTDAYATGKLKLLDQRQFAHRC